MMLITKESDYTSNLHEQVRERLKAQIENKS